MDPQLTGPVVSGTDYLVDGLGPDDTPPGSLQDFCGEVSFHVSLGAHRHHVLGIGAMGDDTPGEPAIALVHEKLGDVGGRDVRVWHVAPAATGFTARHVAPTP